MGLLEIIIWHLLRVAIIAFLLLVIGVIAAVAVVGIKLAIEEWKKPMKE